MSPGSSFSGINTAEIVVSSIGICVAGVVLVVEVYALYANRQAFANMVAGDYRVLPRDSRRCTKHVARHVYESTR